MSGSNNLAARIGQIVDDDRKKIGGMTFGATMRLGLAELRQGVSLEGSVSDQTATPYGMYGTLTPGEVTSARKEGTVHGPVEQGDDANDPVTAARQSAAASAVGTDRGNDNEIG